MKIKRYLSSINKRYYSLKQLKTMTQKEKKELFQAAYALDQVFSGTSGIFRKLEQLKRTVSNEEYAKLEQIQNNIDACIEDLFELAES